jgi:chromosome partitioning protein
MRGTGRAASSEQKAARRAAKPPLTIAFGNQKGGVGKTTLVINLAAALMRGGRITTVIDLDPQKSAERYGEHRAQETGEEAPVVVHGSADNLKDMIETAHLEGVEAILIDCPGALDRTLLLAAACADVVVVPTRSSLLDRNSLRDTLEFLVEAVKIHKCLVVLNAARDGADGGIREVEDLADTFGAVLAATRIEDNRAYSVSLGKGRSVLEGAGARSKPARAIDQLAREIETFHEQAAKAHKRRQK